MYKLVICDFDKTLIDDDYSIPISTVITIDKLRRKKIKFVVLTEKSLNFVKYYIKDVNFIDYIVSLDGSNIYNVEKEKNVFEKNIKVTDIRKIVNKYRNQSIKMYFYTDNSRCYLNDTFEDCDEIIIRDINDFLKNNKVYKIDLETKNKNEATKLYNDITKLNLDIQLYKEQIDNKYVVGIINKKCSKYLSVLEILKKEKISIEEVLYYTHDTNDENLINNAGLVIAVDNANLTINKEKIKRTLSNNKKGIEKSLIDIFNKE